MGIFWYVYLLVIFTISGYFLCKKKPYIAIIIMLCAVIFNLIHQKNECIKNYLDLYHKIKSTNEKLKT